MIEWLAYFVLFGILGAWAASDARDRGKNKDYQTTVFITFLIFGIIALIIWLISRPKKNTAKLAHTETPVQILKTRYAKGEITKKQFEEQKRHLK